MFAFSLLSLLLATATLAAPSRRQNPSRNCSVPGVDFRSILPQSFTPINSVLFTTVGLVIQNYTCSFDGRTLFNGGSGLLLDISCMSTGSKFATIQQDIFNIWSSFAGADPSDPALLPQLAVPFNQIALDLEVLGNEFFQLEQVVKTVFEFGVNTTNQIAFIGQQNQTVPSPDGSIAWEQLQNVAGALANTVYLIDTVGGGDAPKPNASCNPSDNLSPVKYTGKFVFT